MIVSIKDKRLSTLLEQGRSRGLPDDVVKRLRRKLAQLDAAVTLEDLRVPPSNHLESLVGDRSDQHSIRVNKQWRLCFVWLNGDIYDLELVDYH